MLSNSKKKYMWLLPVFLVSMLMLSSGTLAKMGKNVSKVSTIKMEDKTKEANGLDNLKDIVRAN